MISVTWCHVTGLFHSRVNLMVLFLCCSLSAIISWITHFLLLFNILYLTYILRIYQDKNKKTQKVWNLIVVGLANKQCAIVLRFSPKWEQVVWTNYDPWNALSRCCVKTFTILTMKYVIVCGRIKKWQTNRCQKQVANYCPVKDDLYVTYTSWIISWNKLDKPLERRY